MTITYDKIIHAIVILLAVVGAVVWLAWVQLKREYRPFLVAPLSYLAHVLIFSVCRFLSIPENNSMFVNRWSMVIRIHSLLFILVWAYVMHELPDQQKMLEEKLGKYLNGG